METGNEHASWNRNADQTVCLGKKCSLFQKLRTRLQRTIADESWEVKIYLGRGERRTDRPTERHTEESGVACAGLRKPGRDRRTQPRAGRARFGQLSEFTSGGRVSLPAAPSRPGRLASFLRLLFAEAQAAGTFGRRLRNAPETPGGGYGLQARPVALPGGSPFDFRPFPPAALFL